MSKVLFALVAILTVTAVPDSDAQTTQILSAPTFCIAASGQYGSYSTALDVKGASILPPGSRLSVALQDFIGFKSSILSEDAVAVLNKDGFFEATLIPRKGKQFKENMVCLIFFDPHGVQQQDTSVLNIVGGNGELLGVQNNPQVAKNSGGYYLQAFVYIP